MMQINSYNMIDYTVASLRDIATRKQYLPDLLLDSLLVSFPCTENGQIITLSKP